MSYQSAKRSWIAWLTILLGLLCQIMPMPSIAVYWRPSWLLLVLIYWSMALPHRFNIFTALTFGIVLDILLGSPLGVHSLAFSLVIYVVALHFQRLRNFPIWQQSIVIGLLICFAQLVIFWLEFFINSAQFGFKLFLPGLFSALLWPWIFMILRRVRRSYKVR